MIRTVCTMLIASCLGVAGCANSPPVSFYALSAGNGPVPAPARPELVVAVGPVTLVEMADRPQLVVRVSANRLNILEQQRWAEPLRTGIARVVAENLARLLGSSSVTAYPRDPRGESGYRVALDVTQFEAQPGEAVVIDATWTIRSLAGGTLRSGRTLATEAVAASGFEALVAGHSRALETISREIAQAIAAIPIPSR